MTNPPEEQSASEINGRISKVVEHFNRADWQSLVEVSLDQFKQKFDRGHAAVYAACAHHHLGDHDAARELVWQAIDLKCPHDFIFKMLLGAVHQTLARAAAIGGDVQKCEQHFLLARTIIGKEIDAGPDLNIIKARELAQLGFLIDAAGALQSALENAGADMDIDKQKSEIDILGSELRLLQHELSIALSRGQIMRPSGDTGELQNQSVSQLGQDLWVLERTNFKLGGYFVEFGATDGLVFSNTYLLETAYAWTGLLAEPNPKFLDALRKNRKATASDACISAVTGEEVEFIFADVFGGMAKHAGDDKHGERRQAYKEAGRATRLETISLHDFLTQHNAPHDIDYVSVDTEGSEYEILKTFPFEKWNVRCWTVEHNFTPLRDKIFDLMTSHGYQRIEAQWDDWYFR